MPRGVADVAIRTEDEPESEQGRLGRVCARLERARSRSGHRAVDDLGARLQVGPSWDLDPVETVRRPPILLIGAKTQSDLASNGERPTEIVGPPSTMLGHDSSPGSEGKQQNVDTTVVLAVNK